MLLTVLLVLAIAASSALVFTNRVELLKLAVILALWAAVAAAFVSVIYRRQSDQDQAKARDLKLVYDLQLDREISARREYELTVETQLRRELASELQAQAADEVAALRAELAALRTNLEILFDTDLAHRPAIEHDRTTVRAYRDWAPDTETTGRVSSSRLDEMLRNADVGQSESRTEESPIIDVPAEPHPPEPDVASPPPGFGGAHRRPSEAKPQTQEEPRPRRRRAEEASLPGEAPAWAAPAAAPSPPPRREPTGEPLSQPDPDPDTNPGISRLSEPPVAWERPAHAQEPPPEYVGRRRAQEPPTPPPPEPRRGRHSPPGDGGEAESAVPRSGPVQGPQETADEAHARRRRSLEDTGGQSVAELLARLQANPTGGGRRRREP